jgi:excisionase family DNA binding protein
MTVVLSPYQIDFSLAQGTFPVKKNLKAVVGSHFGTVFFRHGLIIHIFSKRSIRSCYNRMGFIGLTLVATFDRFYSKDLLSMVNVPNSSTSLNVQNERSYLSLDDSFSPKKVATSIGVSESSLKRWCDSGFLTARKTAGGHRRIPRSEVISFVKRKNLKLVKPQNIGLPKMDDISVSGPQDAIAQFHAALLSNSPVTCRKLMVLLFLDGFEVADIFDQVVSPAFQQIGTSGRSGFLDVHQENQASAVCLEAIRQVNDLLPPPKPSARLAIGGAIAGDQFEIPTQALEVTMASLGWRAFSLGNDLPLSSLLQLAREHLPDLLWLSVSHLKEPHRAVLALNEFASRVPGKTTVVFSGSAVTADIRKGITHAICCDNFSQMASLVKHYQPKINLMPPRFERVSSPPQS